MRADTYACIWRSYSDGQVRFATVDCTKETALCGKQGVNQYPTVKVRACEPLQWLDVTCPHPLAPMSACPLQLIQGSTESRMPGIPHSVGDFEDFYDDFLDPPVTVLTPDSFAKTVGTSYDFSLGLSQGWPDSHGCCGWYFLKRTK